MAGDLQPLDQKFPIVDEHGQPTPYFIKWAQQRQIDIGGSITLADLQAYLTAHLLKAGQGIALTPDGNLDNSPSISILNGVGLNFDAMHNLKLADTAVVPGTYGDTTHVAQITVDQQGRITGVALVAISGGGGAAASIGLPALGAVATPSVNFYIMRMLVADQAFAINKVAFKANAATPTAKFQPFVYASSAAGVPGALLGSGPQVTGVVAGYNEAPLTVTVNVAKGDFFWLGVNVITAAIAGLWHTAGLGAFSANGGSSVPANPAPAITNVTTYNGVYGFWGVP